MEFVYRNDHATDPELTGPAKNESYKGWIVHVVWDLSTPYNGGSSLSTPAFTGYIEEDKGVTLIIRSFYTGILRTLTWKDSTWVLNVADGIIIKLYSHGERYKPLPVSSCDVDAPEKYVDTPEKYEFAFLYRDLESLNEFAKEGIYPNVTMGLLKETLMADRIEGIDERVKDKALLKWLIDNISHLECDYEAIFCTLFYYHLFDLLIYVHEELHVPVPDLEVLELDFSDIDMDIIVPMLIWLNSKKPFTQEYIVATLESSFIEKQSDKIKAWFLKTFCHE